MDIQLRITRIQKALEEVDDENVLTTLENILSLFKRAQKTDTETIGFSIDNSPISKSDLISEVQAASNRVKSGDFISQEEMENDLKNW